MRPFSRHASSHMDYMHGTLNVVGISMYVYNDLEFSLIKLLFVCLHCLGMPHVHLNES